jgi:hypothetical protein
MLVMRWAAIARRSYMIERERADASGDRHIMRRVSRLACVLGCWRGQQEQGPTPLWTAASRG